MQEVGEAEMAIQVLIDRALAIQAAKEARIRQVCKEVPPASVTEDYMSRLTDFLGHQAYIDLVLDEKRTDATRSKQEKGTVVWAEAELATPEVLQQFPVALHKVRCCATAQHPLLHITPYCPTSSTCIAPRIPKTPATFQ